MYMYMYNYRILKYKIKIKVHTLNLYSIKLCNSLNSTDNM